jgi:hypothetical protein
MAVYRLRVMATKPLHRDIHEWLDIAPPPGLVVSSKPMLTGAGSVFNLAGTLDEPIVGLMRPDVPPLDEASELLPFYVDQAERIIGQTEEMMLVSETIFEAARVLAKELSPPFFAVTHERKRSRKDREKNRQNSKRFS